MCLTLSKTFPCQTSTLGKQTLIDTSTHKLMCQFITEGHFYFELIWFTPLI